METGAAFGPWLLDKRLGVGGMGEVWLATHRVLGTQIAVKVLAPELTRDPRFRERFISEAKVQARLSHPHIAHIQDFLEEGGRFAILMELIPGGTVADAIDRAGGPLPIVQTLKWAGQALEALDYAHRHGVIHRDVKPANLMLDGAGDIKVTDFGIAIALGVGRMTTTGRSIGTPQYMSPEQIMRPQSVDHRTDVYSMGVVLYEMLAGRAPFDADTDYTLQRLHIEAQPPSLRSLNPLVPAWLESVVLQCLAKGPDDRFAGCASAAAALHQRPSPTVPTADRATERSARAPTELTEPSKGAVEEAAAEPLHRRPQPGAKSRSTRTAALVASSVAVIALAAIWWWARQKPQSVPGSPPALVEQTKQLPALHPPSPAPAPLDRELGTLRKSVVVAIRAKDWPKVGPLIDSLLAKFPADAEALEWRKLLAEGRKSDLFAKLGAIREEPNGAAPFTPPPPIPDDVIPASLGGSGGAAPGPAAPTAQRRIFVPPNLPAPDPFQIATRADAAYARQDYATAAPLYQQLAATGRTDAMIWLGHMYEEGLGVVRSDPQAVIWYRMAAEKGDAMGMTNLASMYEDGRGVAQDDAQAVAWFRKAADVGEPSGMNDLGIMYESGRGVTQDQAQAVGWYRKAAEAGLPQGMSNLGAMYASGRGVAQDEAQAVAWFRKAAEKGFPAGINDLGAMYEQGRGVAKDTAEALAWYRKAAALGNEEAKANLKRLGQ